MERSIYIKGMTEKGEFMAYKPFRVRLTYFSGDTKRERLYEAEYLVRDFSIIEFADGMHDSVSGELMSMSDRRLTDDDVYIREEPEEEPSEELDSFKGLDPICQYLDFK